MMEKIIETTRNLLGGKENGSRRTGNFDVPTLLKNVVLLMLTFGSIAFTAGLYATTARELPAKVQTIERKIEAVERKQDGVQAALDAILRGQAEQSADIRELRAALLADRRSNAR